MKNVWGIVSLSTNDLHFKQFAQSRTLRGMVYKTEETAKRALKQLSNPEDYRVVQLDLTEVPNVIR